MATEQPRLEIALPATPLTSAEPALTPAAAIARPDFRQGQAQRRQRGVRATSSADVLGLFLAAAVSAVAAGAADRIPALLLFVGTSLVLFRATGLGSGERLALGAGLLDELPRLLQAITLAAGLTLMAGPAVVTVDGGTVTVAWLLACATVPLGRGLARAAVRGSTANERVLILGSGVIAELVASKITNHPELGLDLVGALDDGAPHGTGTLNVLGGLRDVERVVDEQRVDSVIIAFSANPHIDLLEAIRRCRHRQVKVSVVPRLFEEIGLRVQVHDVEGLTLLGLQGATRSRGALAAKRAIDVTGALAALTVLAPLIVAIAVAIRLTSPGPAVFRQTRIGHRQQPFRMLKFRTMVDGADALKPQVLHLNEVVGGTMFKARQDPRVTRIGRLLRATSLDELPQFINVLRGEMSIVGPRPLVQAEDDGVLGWHRSRLELIPGLTGPWQVMGRQQIPFDEMVKLDYLYVAEWSLWNDVKLMLRTVPVVLRRTGA